MTRMRKTGWLATVVWRAIALLVGIVAGLAVTTTAATAAPATNHFSAYDYRYETSYSCYGQTCWYVPYNSGYTSTFNAPALRSTPIRDSIGGRLNSGGFTVAAGQNVGVICWQAASDGSIWLVTDSRHQVDPARPDTALFVGWVVDADTLLSRADRLAYVVECGYLPASASADVTRWAGR